MNRIFMGEWFTPDHAIAFLMCSAAVCVFMWTFACSLSVLVKLFRGHYKKDERGIW